MNTYRFRTTKADYWVRADCYMDAWIILLKEDPWANLMVVSFLGKNYDIDNQKEVLG